MEDTRAALLQSISQVEAVLHQIQIDIAEYTDLVDRLDALQGLTTSAADQTSGTHSTSSPKIAEGTVEVVEETTKTTPQAQAQAGPNIVLESLTELGAGVFVDAQTSVPSTVLLDIGYDVHLDMPLGEAREYARKRAEVLAKRRERLAQRRSAMIEVLDGGA